MKMKSKLKAICSWLNANYNQDSENYSIFCGSKPGIIKYDEHTVISPWACGAIVCIYAQLYFIQEDDGNWFVNEEKNNEYAEYNGFGYQDGFSIAWAESFTNAMLELKKYVYENGTPVYFSGLSEKIVCHYTL